MSSNYSANQFDDAFHPQRLQNWSVPKPTKKERPSIRVGHTSFIADSRGHLFPEVKRGSAWPDFKGTWNFPDHVTANHINKLKSQRFCPPKRDKPLSDRSSRNTDVGKQTSKDVHQSVADPSTGAESLPGSQKDPFTGCESHSSSKKHEAGIPAELALQATMNDKPKLATEKNPSLKCEVLH